jgi:peptidoglycan lytic transglycosylase
MDDQRNHGRRRRQINKMLFQKRFSANFNRKGVRGESFRHEQLGIIVAVLALATVWNLGIATAQTAEEGIANFYSDKFQGKKTASGAVYDKNKLTASHKTLPYGTKVRVTNLDNGKSVVVTVNDRMKPGSPAVIDVTRRAAQDLGFAKAGKAKVKVEVEK